MQKGYVRERGYSWFEISEDKSLVLVLPRQASPLEGPEDVVLRQEMIKGLHVESSQAYQQKQAEISELEGKLRMFGGGSSRRKKKLLKNLCNFLKN